MQVIDATPAAASSQITRALSPAHASGKGGALVHGVAREHLTFRLGSEEYGLDILRVQEIRSYEEPTHIAGAPSFLKGVINLRGVIVPIVDLRVKFGCDSLEFTPFT